MQGVAQIEKDFYFIQQVTRPGWFCGIYVITGADSIGIVDSGFENTPSEYLLPFLKEIGRAPTDVSMLFNTHGDGDHMLGNAAVKELCGAKTACHEDEADAIEGIDILVKDGDAIGLGDRTFTVVHCPGHRAGNCCLFDTSASLLIAGDTIVGTQAELIRLGKQPYIASLKKIRALHPVKVIMSHPFEPAGKNVLEGEEIADMIEASIEVAQKL